MRTHLHAYARRIYATSFPYRYWTLSLLALSSSLHASYAISVRRASVLPAASFRFHLAMDTLAVRLMVPPVGSIGDFHSLVRAPCRAHQRKGRVFGLKTRPELKIQSKPSSMAQNSKRTASCT